MKRCFVICVALVAGCGRHEVKQMQRVRDEVCACKTVACGEAALTHVPPKDVKSTPKSQALAREMLDCMAKLYDEARPAQSDDADDAE